MIALLESTQTATSLNLKKQYTMGTIQTSKQNHNMYWNGQQPGPVWDYKIGSSSKFFGLDYIV